MALFNKDTLKSKKHFCLEFYFHHDKLNGPNALKIIHLVVPVESDLGHYWIKAVEALNNRDIELKYVYAARLEQFGLIEMERSGILQHLNDYHFTMPFGTVFPCRQILPKEEEYYKYLNEGIEIILI